MNTKELDRAFELLTKKRCSRDVSLHSFGLISEAVLNELRLNVESRKPALTGKLSAQRPEMDAVFLYYMNPLANNHIYNGTVYLSILKALIRHTDTQYPPGQVTINSKYSVDANKQPLNITYIYNSVVRCLRVALIRHFIRNTNKILASYEKGFVDNMALLSTELFNWDNPGSFDLLVEPADFLKIAEQLGDMLVILFSYSFIRNPLYQKVYHLFRSRADANKNCRSLSDFNKHIAEIEIQALEITDFIDQFLINTPSVTSSPLPSLSLNSNTVAGNGRLFQNIPYDSVCSSPAFEEMENILGYNVKFRHFPPAPGFNNFNDIISINKKYISGLFEVLRKILSKHNSRLTRFFEDSGQVDIDNIHRRQSDGLIFKDELMKVKLSSKFNIVFVIDNSCSINDNKKRIMQQILSLLLLSINAFPAIFGKVIAYAQNTDGSRTVALRKLIDEKAGEIRNLNKVMHINSSGINYDVFALFKIIKIHAKDLADAGAANIVILIGDSWPIGVEGDVIAEQMKVLNHLKSCNKNLIIIYIATDPNRQPRELSYDYFLSQQSSEFSMEVFLSQFSNVITKILK